MPRSDVKSVITHAKKAWENKHHWDGLLRDCYEFALPQRNPYHNTSDGILHPGAIKGQRKTDRVFDSTLVQDTIKLANLLQSRLTPPFQKWAKLTAGPFVQDDQIEAAIRALEPLTKTMFASIHISNFDTAINEWYLELIVAGTACMMVVEGDDDVPVRYITVPQSQVALREGPWGEIWGVYRKHSMQIGNIQGTWTDATLPDKLKNEKDQSTEVLLMEATYYDAKAKKWYYDVMIEGQEQESRIVEREYDESPWVIGRWIKSCGEVQGRSPVMFALPDAKTLNKMKELVLRNASIAVSGVWMVRDDGVINANNVRIFPGATIPVGSTGGANGASIQPLDFGGDLQLSELVSEDLKTSIHEIMMNKGLPDAAGPVRSPTEIIERLKELQQDLGSPFGRITGEGIVPMLQKTLYRLSKSGIIQMEAGRKIKLNGGHVQVQFSSPLAQAEQTNEVQKALEWMQSTKGVLGEEAFMLNCKIEDAGALLGQLMDVQPGFMRTKDEREDMQEKIGTMAGQAQQAEQAQAGIPATAGQQGGQQVPIAA